MDTRDGVRLHIGQLLVHQTRLFREQLYRRASERGWEDVRPAHLQVFGTIKGDGSRLTDLAVSANMSQSSMVELIDDLQQKGYVERRPDPADGRAKLVRLTDKGWATIRLGRQVIAEIERDYAQRIGVDRFEQLCAALQDLLDELEPDFRRRYEEPSPPTVPDA